MKRRTISTEEYQFALSLFEREFPPRDKITITDETGLGGRPYVRPTIDGHIRINIGKLYNKCLDSENNKATFAHELTHAWQIEHYGLLWYSAQAIDNQILSGDAYSYVCDPAKTLGDYNAEQQGEIVADYFRQKPCAATVARKTLASDTWKLLIGSDGKDVAVDADGTCYLVNTAGIIYKYIGNDWQQLSGSNGLAIDANNGKVCLVNTKGLMYTLQNGSWKQMPGSNAKDIAVTEAGVVWMVNSAGKIYQYQGASWTQMNGSDGLRIAAGGGQVWLVNRAGNIYLFNDSAWQQMPGSNARDITVSKDGSVFLTNTVGKIYKWNGKAWDLLDGGNGKAVAANNGMLVMVNTKGRLYYRTFAPVKFHNHLSSGSLVNTIK